MAGVSDRNSMLALAGLKHSESEVLMRWRNIPPTPIQRPTNDTRPQGPPPTETRIRNPLNQSMRAQGRARPVGNTSLHNASANPRRPAPYSAPLAKRPRLEPYASTSAKSLSSHSIPSRSRNREGLRIRPDSDLDDSSDEMNFRPSKFAFTSDKVPGSSTRALTMPQEGEAFIKLEAKVEAKFRELSDPIEEFPDHVGPGVKQLVQQYEDTSTSCEPRPPKLDLRQRNLKLGMKKSSKARELSATPALVIKRFRTGVAERNQSIPVHSCYVNDDLYRSIPLQKMSMHTDLGRVSITEKGKTHWTGSLIDEHYTVIHGDPATLEEIKVIQFQPRDPTTLPTVTIQLDTSDKASWDGSQYSHFLQQLEKQGVKKLVMRHTKQLWEMAEQNAQSSHEGIDNQGNSRGRKANVEASKVPASSRQESTTLKPGKRKALNLEDSLTSNQGNDSSSAERGAPLLELPKPKRELRRTQRNLRSTSKAVADGDVEVVDTRVENPDETILSFPAGQPGAMTISNADLMRLKPGQFLNDTIIEFGLKLWLRELERSDPVLASQIHIFNSFFYKKLNSKDPQVGYESVRKWTSKIDIFSKKYIVVPINENVHWYLAIIYEPEHILEPTPAKNNSPSRPQTRRSTALLKTPNSEDRTTREESLETRIDELEQHSELEIERDLHNFNTSCTIDSKEQELPKSRRYGDLFDEDSPSPKLDVVMSSPDQLNLISNISRSPTPSYGQSSKQQMLSAADDMIVDVSDSPARPPLLSGATTRAAGAIDPASFYQPTGRRKPNSKKRARDDSDAPSIDSKESTGQVVVVDAPKTYIFTFDSLGGRHTQAINKLTAYLKMEAKDKKGIDEAGVALGKTALVPSQGNFCDCGIYLLHFAQTFLSDAKNYANIVLTSTPKSMTVQERNRIWREEEILNNSGRDMLASRILSLSEQWKKHREAKERTPVYNVEKSDESEGEVELVESDLGKKSKRPKSGPAARVRG